MEEQAAWSGHLRSKATLRKSPKRHFVDPALAAAALAATPERLLNDLNLLGLLFKSLVVRDLRIYSQGLDGEVSHYRDSNGQEADAVVQLADEAIEPRAVATFSVALGFHPRFRLAPFASPVANDRSNRSVPLRSGQRATLDTTGRCGVHPPGIPNPKGS